MRRARLYLPVVICLAVIALIALTQSAHGLEGLLLIAGAAFAIAVLDLFSRHAGRVSGPDRDDPEHGAGAPPAPPRR
ncbi:MAG: hypothetical protein ACSLFR_12295 [Solirubrobacteraceae bacterium]